MEAQALPDQEPGGTAEVLEKIEAVATSQRRVEELLMDLHRDLGALSLHLHSLGQPPTLPPGSRQSSKGPAVRAEASMATLASEDLVEAQEQAQDNVSLAPEELEVPPSLPRDWPASLQSRLGIATDEPMSRTSLPRDSKANVALRSKSYQSQLEDTIVKSEGWMRHIIVDPNSAAYTVYNLLCLLVLVHDVLSIPFALAWDLDMVGLPAATAWISCCFWTIDVGVSCITGFSHAGILELRPSVVVRRYAITWLVPDVAVNICDWVGLLLTFSIDEDSWGSVRLLRVLKLGKLLRLIGLIRMMRAVRTMEDVVQNRLGGAGRLLLQCCVFSCSLLLMNHLLACAWYAIGRMAPSDTGMRWIDLTTDWNGEELKLSQHELQHQYISAVHWSMAQIVGGNMDILAYNSSERVYNMFCLALGLLFGASIVSTLSTSLVEYQVSRNDQIQKISQLRRFLKESKIRRGTAALVLQQASSRLSMRSKIQEGDVQALQVLSTSLRSSLRYERFKEHLSRHALFRLWIDLDRDVVRELCMLAMDSAALASHDHLFKPGVKCSKAYCAIEGQLMYFQEPTTAPVPDVICAPVKAGQWICEAALWSHWVHVGRATARTQSQVLSISSEAMMEVLQKYGPVTKVTAEYSRHFYRCTVTARPPRAPWPTDLEVPFTEFSDLVVSMDPEVQVTIGLSALDQNARFRKYIPASRRDSLADLEDEVLRGKSCVLMNAEGVLQRVVSVVVLHMRSRHDKVLAELGKMGEDAPLAGSCQLPGLKQEVGEMLNSTLARLLARFHLQAEDVELTRLEREVTWKVSQEYGVHTKYVRTIHHVRLLQKIPLPELAMRPRSCTAESAREQFHRLSTGLFRNSKGSLSSPFTLPAAPVYKVQSGNKSIFYTWLDAEGFQHLRSPAGEQDLSRWLNSLAETELEELAI